MGWSRLRDCYTDSEECEKHSTYRGVEACDGRSHTEICKYVSILQDDAA